MPPAVLAHSRCSINACLMNELMNEGTNTSLIVTVVHAGTNKEALATVALRFEQQIKINSVRFLTHRIK